MKLRKLGILKIKFRKILKRLSLTGVKISSRNKGKLYIPKVINMLHISSLTVATFWTSNPKTQTSTSSAWCPTLLAGNNISTKYCQEEFNN